MEKFTIGDCVTFGWRTFKARPWFFIGIPFLIILVLIASTVVQSVALLVFGKTLGQLVSILISLAVNTFIGIGTVSVFLKAHDAVMAPTYSDFWQPRFFVPYLLTYVLLAVIVGFGFILLIVPGIIFGIMFGFATYFVIDKNMKPIEALKESKRITKGRLWRLFLLGIVLLLVNVLGALVLLVGLLVSIPVSTLALVHAYRALSGTSPHATSEVLITSTM